MSFVRFVVCLCVSRLLRCSLFACCRLYIRHWIVLLRRICDSISGFVFHDFNLAVNASKQQMTISFEFVHLCCCRPQNWMSRFHSCPRHGQHTNCAISNWTKREREFRAKTINYELFNRLKIKPSNPIQRLCSNFHAWLEHNVHASTKGISKPHKAITFILIHARDSFDAKIVLSTSDTFSAFNWSI